MPFKQTPKLTLADPQPFRQGFGVRVVEGSRLDQPECPGHGVGAPAPEGKFG